VQKVSTHAAVASGPSPWRFLVQQGVLTFIDGVVCQHSVSRQAVCRRSHNTTVCMCAFVKVSASCSAVCMLQDASEVTHTSQGP
jgi:hypothetical protein